MLEFPRWKVVMVTIVTLFFMLTALPNALPPSVVAKFPGFLPKSTVPLGLDLRGGSHLLLELDFDTYKREHFANVRDGLRETLRKAKVGYTDLRASGNEVSLRIRQDTVGSDVKINDLFRKVDPDLSVDENDGLTRFYYDDAKLKALQLRLLEQSIEIVERRVNETGTKEPIVQRQGADRIVVQVPGLADPAELKRLLGKTAKMTFHLVNEDVSPDAISRNVIPSDTMILPSDESSDKKHPEYPTQYAIYSQVALGGEHLTNANASFSEGTIPVVEFQFNTLGAQKFGDITQANIGKRFAIVLDNKVITAPVIRTAILGGRGIIEGSFTTESANELAMLLRAGALPAPLNVIEERSVGPSLGQDSINAGTLASIIGITLVVVFMFLSYGLFGIFANLGLAVHLITVLGTMSLMQATLTLPGIAGIVLTMGMGVDANVLIFERIRDEIRFDKSPLAAIHSGFNLAFGTIFDSNITTLIAAMLLYTLGAGAVKGFAVTLIIGILSSMFASVLFCRMLIIFWARRTKPKRIPI
ncbi:MAG: protein translocase subunit SecD [Rickettsiales bacterium]